MRFGNRDQGQPDKFVASLELDGMNGTLAGGHAYWPVPLSEKGAHHRGRTHDCTQAKKSARRTDKTLAIRVPSTHAAAHKTNTVSQRLDTVPGVATLTATAFAASVADASVFKSGRAFAAWLGLTPKISGSGGSVTLGPITRQGDRYLRRLLFTGALSVLVKAKRQPADYPWITKLLGKLKFKQVVIALANKMARIIWALMVRGGTYEAGHQAQLSAPRTKGSGKSEFAGQPA